MNIMKTTLVAISILLLVIVSCCINDTNVKKELNAEINGIITIDKEGKLPDYVCRSIGIENDIIIIHSKYCGACKMALPYLKEIEDEKGLEFNYIDISTDEGRDMLNKMGLYPRYTPTVIIGCDVHIGAYSKEKYEKWIDELLGE